MATSPERVKAKESVSRESISSPLNRAWTTREGVFTGGRYLWVLASLATGLAGLPGALRAQQARVDPRAAILVERGCTRCHGVWALGVRSRADVGPDLTFAEVDVPNRYHETLDVFLNDPRGVMRMMLASHLHLTAADRDSIVHLLAQIYDQHRAQVRTETPPITADTESPSH